VGEYTVTAIASVLVVLALEFAWLRTGLLREARYWITMAIVLGFQVLVDGWLTKLSAPIVVYAPGQYLGVRWPWDVPVEDYLFGFAMVGGAIVLWERAKAVRASRSGSRVASRTGKGDVR
jgi:lycopene cyclase domain-containing protein